jgi:hypothetical protein
MEKIVEKLSQEKFDKILEYQKDANQLILELGQIQIQERDLKFQLKKLEQIKDASCEKFDTISLQLDNILNDLQKNYPNGELDLNEGTITYEK